MKILPRSKHCHSFATVVVVGILCVLIPVAPVCGQKQYTPDHPEVEAMVRKAVSWLNSGGGKEVGYKILGALAIVEAGKRYDQKIPTNNGVVRAAISAILKELGNPKTGRGLLESEEMYEPTLALILLAEVDDVKYRPQIKKLIGMLKDRQDKNGGYTYRKERGRTSDNSQTQFAALAMHVAKEHGFEIDPNLAAKTLEYIISVQQPNGSWTYKVSATGSRGGGTPSMHAAGLGTAYLLGDFLQLAPRKKNMTKGTDEDSLFNLPRTVTVYVKPAEGDNLLVKSGPLVNFNTSRLNQTVRAGNIHFEKIFTVFPGRWDFYYLYAVERYAWFREQTEGNLGGGKLATWYDQVVNQLKKRQLTNGSFKNAKFPVEKEYLATAFAVLVLVRSSEVISLPSSEGELVGGEGFPDDELRVEGGQLVTTSSEKNLSDMMEMLKDDEVSPEQLAALNKSLKKAVTEFKQKQGKSRSEIKTFLRTMIAHNNYYRRKIAVRFLAGEQDLDNVPALIYAVSDPDFRIAIEAHDGLRLISRRIDSLNVSDRTRKNAVRDPDVLTKQERTAMELEFASLKKKWTDWYLKLRPDAESQLFD